MTTTRIKILADIADYLPGEASLRFARVLRAADCARDFHDFSEKTSKKTSQESKNVRESYREYIAYKGTNLKEKIKRLDQLHIAVEIWLNVKKGDDPNQEYASQFKKNKKELNDNSILPEMLALKEYVSELKGIVRKDIRVVQKQPLSQPERLVSSKGPKNKDFSIPSFEKLHLKASPNPDTTAAEIAPERKQESISTEVTGPNPAITATKTEIRKVGPFSQADGVTAKDTTQYIKGRFATKDASKEIKKHIIRDSADKIIAEMKSKQRRNEEPMVFELKEDDKQEIAEREREKNARINEAIVYLRENKKFFLLPFSGADSDDSEILISSLKLAPHEKIQFSKTSDLFTKALAETKSEEDYLQFELRSDKASDHRKYQKGFLSRYKSALKALPSDESKMRALLGERELLLSEIINIKHNVVLNPVIDRFMKPSTAKVQSRPASDDSIYQTVSSAESKSEVTTQLVSWITAEVTKIPDSYQSTHTGFLSRKKNLDRAKQFLTNLQTKLADTRSTTPLVKLTTAILLLRQENTDLMQIKLKKKEAFNTLDFVEFNKHINEEGPSYKLMVSYLLRMIYDQIASKGTPEEVSKLKNLIPADITYISINDTHKSNCHLDDFKTYLSKMDKAHQTISVKKNK